MLINLDTVRKERNVSLVDIADLLHVRYQTVSDKIRGESSFKVSEACLIHETFFPEYDFKFLFKSEILHMEVS